MTILICIDPGTDTSGIVHLDSVTRKVLESHSKAPNDEVIDMLEMIKTYRPEYKMVYEMIACYGMPVGASTFGTCVWIGRFIQTFGADRCISVFRKEVKSVICGSMKAKDSNVMQALKDRYMPTGGGKNPAVGTKKQPGPLFGMASHAWSALAVGHTYLDIQKDLEQ